MNLKFIKYFISILLALFISCDDQLEETSHYAVLEPFDNIELNSVFDVYLSSDSLYSIKIAGEENAIKNISFKVVNRILSVNNNAKWKWLTPEDNKIKLYISSNQLSQIIVKETCNIQTLNTLLADEFSIINHPKPRLSQINLELDCKTFFYWNNYQCGGKLKLRGRTDNLVIYSFALMSVDASALTSNHALIENNSRGDCEVRVKDKIEYKIGGSGNIYLHGTPEIVLLEKKSTGRLIHLD